MTGSAAAKKMPLFFESLEVQPIIEGIKSYLQGGFDINEIVTNDDNIQLSFGRCALREICELENIPLGGNLCMLFHNYINGMIVKLTEKNFKMNILEAGNAACIIKHNTTVLPLIGAIWKSRKSMALQDVSSPMDKEKTPLEVIKQATSEKWAALDLSVSFMKKLPPEIGNLTNLEVLTLKGIVRFYI